MHEVGGGRSATLAVKAAGTWSCNPAQAGESEVSGKPHHQLVQQIDQNGDQLFAFACIGTNPKERLYNRTPHTLQETGVWGWGGEGGWGWGWGLIHAG